MGILGASPVDIQKCFFAKDEEACERVFFGYILFPLLQRELERIKLLASDLLPPPKPPLPDPPPIAPELAAVLLRPHIVGDKTSPGLDADVRLAATRKFREGLANVGKRLDEEIDRLEKQAAS
jgi:hypothetical protein